MVDYGGEMPHPLRENNQRVFPQRMLFYDTETNIHKKGNRETEHTLNLGRAVYIREGRKEKWLYFESEEEFWNIVEERAYIDSPLYIFAHNEDYDFHILKGWSELLSRGWIKEFVVIEHGIFFAKFSKWINETQKKEIIITDTFNLFSTSLRKIGKELGEEKREVDLEKATKEEISEYCKRDVEIIRDVIFSLFNLLKEKNLSGFKPTIAGLAVSIYRHRFLYKGIYVHKKKQVTTLERKAYRGGRCECFRLGEFKGRKFYKLDINSMYPYCMLSYNYPAALIDDCFNVSVDTLKDLLQEYCVIADCNITIDKPAIGKKEERLMFYKGQFDQTLTTQELLWVLEHGNINKVRHCAWYAPAPIFKEFVEELYELRKQYDREGKKMFKLIVKNVLNSLYGKTAQQNNRLIETGESIYGNRTEVVFNHETGEKKLVYHIGGKTHEKGDEGTEARDAMPFIAAEVTANARMYLWQFIEKAGLENVYYCDTDSLLVDEEGLERLKDYIDESKLGYFKVEKEALKVEITGLKKYKIADEIKHKGRKKNAVDIGANKYEQEHFFHLKGLMRRPDIKTTGTYISVRKDRYEYKKGRVRPDGIVEPYIKLEGVN